ncbi:hypothetical protein, partial [Enterobacter intestinihominis]
SGIGPPTPGRKHITRLRQQQKFQQHKTFNAARRPHTLQQTFTTRYLFYKKINLPTQLFESI